MILAILRLHFRSAKRYLLELRCIRRLGRDITRSARTIIGFGAAPLFKVKIRPEVHVSSSVMLLSVYRKKNASVILPLIDEAQRCHWEIRLWALDSVHPKLERFSRGFGPGHKFSLLNLLATPEELRSTKWLVVMDDDALVERGSLASFLAVAEAAGLSLAQPAHGERSFWNHRITVRDPLAIARLTTFVEIGPIFAVGQPWISKVLPFPNEFGMGWGLELLWSDLREFGARLGIVDLVTIRHLSPQARQYSTRPEDSRVQRLLQERGLGSFRQMQQTLAVWRPWQKRPPWLSR